VIAALIVDALFAGLGLIPHARPTRAAIFGSIGLDYKLVLNVLGLAIFASLFALTMRRGATDPMCGMKVDRLKALHKDTPGGAVFFCSEPCLEAFEEDEARRGHQARPVH
jgi:YHS domain-containing protein